MYEAAQKYIDKETTRYKKYYDQTEEEDDAIYALLTLGRENTAHVDSLDENSQLMPIGGINLPIDVAPVQVRLDQVSVDQEIAGLQNELTLPPPSPATENTQDAPKPSTSASNPPTALNNDTAPVNDQVVSSPLKQGKIEIKEYGIKRNPGDDKLKFKCVKCEFRSKI